jgi:hypothetical protein
MNDIDALMKQFNETLKELYDVAGVSPDDPVREFKL